MDGGPPVVSDEVFQAAVSATLKDRKTEIAYNIQSAAAENNPSVLSVVTRQKVCYSNKK